MSADKSARQRLENRVCGRRASHTVSHPQADALHDRRPAQHPPMPNRWVFSAQPDKINSLHLHLLIKYPYTAHCLESQPAMPHPHTDVCLLLCVLLIGAKETTVHPHQFVFGTWLRAGTMHQRAAVNAHRSSRKKYSTVQCPSSHKSLSMSITCSALSGYPEAVGSDTLFGWMSETSMDICPIDVLATVLFAKDFGGKLARKGGKPVEKCFWPTNSDAMAVGSWNTWSALSTDCELHNC